MATHRCLPQCPYLHARRSLQDGGTHWGEDREALAVRDPTKTHGINFGMSLSDAEPENCLWCDQTPH